MIHKKRKRRYAKRLGSLELEIERLIVKELRLEAEMCRKALDLSKKRKVNYIA